MRDYCVYVMESQKLSSTYLNGGRLLKLLHDYCVYVLESQKPSTYLSDRWILRQLHIYECKYIEQYLGLYQAHYDGWNFTATLKF